MTDPNEPLFSLPLGEGEGAMLAAAAGDVAGGADPKGYSAVTQCATVVAYHVMVRGEVDRSALEQELLEMDGHLDGDVSTFRGASEELRSWLDSAAGGEAAAWPAPSAEPSSRVAPLAVWLRRRPDALVTSAVTVARMTHLDASTVVLAAASAAAVAAACFAQAGRDLLLAGAETAERALETIETERYRFAGVDAAEGIPARLRELTELVELPIADKVAAFVPEGRVGGIDGVLFGLLVAAPMTVDPIKAIEAGGVHGGSPVGALVGAIVGARTGLRRWPWVVPNDTWFAEIGRRLAAHNSEVRDLPVPYAVEERFILPRPERLID